MEMKRKMNLLLAMLHLQIKNSSILSLKRNNSNFQTTFEVHLQYIWGTYISQIFANKSALGPTLATIFLWVDLLVYLGSSFIFIQKSSCKT